MLRDFKGYGKSLDILNVITNKTKTIKVYPDDMINHIKQLVSSHFSVPVQYELLFNAKGKVIGFGYQDVNLTVPSNYDLRNREDYGLVTDKTRDIFPDIDEVNVLLLDEYIQANFPDVNEYETYELFNDLRMYWPDIILEDITNIVMNKKIRLKEFEDSSTDFYRFIESISVKDIRDKMIVDNVVRVRSRVKYRFDTRIDLNYIFDQAIPDKEVIIYRPNKSVVIRKFNEQKRTAVPIALQNVIPSVRIGENTLVFDEYVSTNDIEILEKIETIIDSRHVYAEDSNKYVFSIQYYAHGFSTNEYAKFVRRFSKDILEQDPKNVGHSNEYVFFYKRVPEHVYVSIKGHNLVNVLIEGISKANIDTLFNFIIRTLYSMTERVTDTSVTNIKGMLKQYDPILYGYHKKDTVSGKLFSRKVLNSKFPIVFQKGSNILEHYIETYKRDYGRAPKTLEYHNFTTGGQNVYICPNKKYHNFIFRTPFDHPRHLCTISCGVKEQKDRALVEACKKGIPFMPDDLEREVNTSDVSNLYYIRQFSNEKNLQTNKLSRLPIALNKIFNTQCQITNNLIGVGSICNLMCGSIDDREFHLTVYHVLSTLGIKQIPFGENQWNFVLDYYDLNINIVLLEYNTITKDINLVQFIEKNALIRALQEMKTVFVLRIISHLGTYYSTIAKLEQPSKKRYILRKYYDGSDQITKTMIEVVKQLGAKYVDFITMDDLITNGIPFTQIRQSGTNIIAGVVVDNVVFPIVPSYINIYYKSFIDSPIDEPDITADHGALMKVIEKLNKIHKIRITSAIYSGDGYMGYYLNEDFFVRFTDGPKKMSVPSVPFFMNTEPRRQTVKKVDFHLNKEIYDTYLFHIAAWINETVMKNYTMEEWKSRLLKVYGSDTHPDFVSDYDHLHRHDYSRVTALKPWKLEILRAKTHQEVLEVLKRMTSNRITFGSSMEVNESNYRKLCPEIGTIDGQCRGNRLVIPKKMYTDYTRLIAMEIVFNAQKRHDILTGVVPGIVNFRNFSTTPGVKIEKTYLLDAEYNES